MGYLKIVLPLFAGTLIYSLTALFAGPKGIMPMIQLEKEKQTIQENLETLHLINENLEIKLNNLSADPDTISVYAHELGYIAEGEQLIKLAGFSGGIDRNYRAGTAFKSKRPEYLPEWMCKIVAILSGALCFFGLSYATRKTSKSHHKRAGLLQ